MYGETITGEKEAYLMVSSSNLTVSGYGRNQEVFSYIKVESQIVAKELSSFIKDLSKDENGRHKAILDYLENGSFIDNEDVSFFWTHNALKETLASYIQDKKPKDITVVSPYFDSDGPKNLLEGFGFLSENSDKKVKIYPSKKGDCFNITKESYKELVSHGVDFYEMISEKDRFIHAKLIKFNDCLIIGSYNFTHAALEGHNSEAALIYKKIDPDFDFENRKNVKNEKCFLDNNKSLGKEEGQNSQEDVFITVEVDWKAEEQVNVHFEYSGEEKNWTLYLGAIGSGDKKGYIADSEDFEQNDFRKPLDDETKENILKHKSFSLYKAGILCTTGLISEKNWEESRPAISCENFYDAVKEWWSDEKSAGGGRNTDPLLFPEDGSTDELLGVLKDTSMDVFDNYFYLAKSFENLISDIKESISNKDSKRLENIFILQPGSLKNLIDLLKNLYDLYLKEKEESEEAKENIEKSKKVDLVYCWLGGKYISYILEIIEYSECGIASIKDDLLNKHNEYMRKIEHEVQNILGDKKAEFIQWVNDYFVTSRSE